MGLQQVAELLGDGDLPASADRGHTLEHHGPPDSLFHRSHMPFGVNTYLLVLSIPGSHPDDICPRTLLQARPHPSPRLLGILNSGVPRLWKPALRPILSAWKGSSSG